jgi:hypothetical protein
MKLLVRPVGGGDFVEHDGDISVGGALFHAPTAVSGERYELKFQLPGSTQVMSCHGEVLRVREAGGTQRVHLKFIELPLELELAIAKYIDDLLAGAKA